ncbi:MAG: AAA family ATPase, partial [Patescibacteria group bacterium]|nr:AAA family ATPase [Patescibacteria group bacterium]
IGLVGSGKSVVAKELAKLIGAAIVETDAVRIILMRRGESFDNANILVRDIARDLIKNGNNVVLDSDFINEDKRTALREMAMPAGIRHGFVRVYADPIVMISRTISADYGDVKKDFFAASSVDKISAKVLKIREMWRRTPNHYRWLDETGGRWELKELACDVLSDIDTTDGEGWKTKVEDLAHKLVSDKQ